MGTSDAHFPCIYESSTTGMGMRTLDECFPCISWTKLSALSNNFSSNVCLTMLVIEPWSHLPHSCSRNESKYHWNFLLDLGQIGWSLQNFLLDHMIRPQVPSYPYYQITISKLLQLGNIF